MDNADNNDKPPTSPPPAPVGYRVKSAKRPEFRRVGRDFNNRDFVMVPASALSDAQRDLLVASNPRTELVVEPVYAEGDDKGDKGKGRKK